MAESASAFSVYKASGVKSGQKGANNKNKASSSTTAQNVRIRNKASGKVPSTESSRAVATVNKPKPKKTVAAASKGALKKNVAVATAASAPVTTKKSSLKTNGTTACVAKKTNVITNNKSEKVGQYNVDKWVDELYNNTKKLTKKQVERKKQLEMYLMTQIAKDDEQKKKLKQRSGKESSDDDDDFNSDNGEDINSGDYNDASSGDYNDDDSWSDLSNDEEEENNNTCASKAAVKRKIVETENKKIKNIKLENNNSTIENNENKPKQQQKQRDSVGYTKSNFSRAPDSCLQKSSIEIGKNMLGWILNPLTVEDFFNKNWERSLCFIRTGAAEKYTRFISFKSIDDLLKSNHLEYTTNVDVTTYKNGIRETLNPEGRATPPSVWANYADGCSIRFLNPHVYLPNLFKLNSTLQELFHCFVGVNAYLTPPNSQGFAPHFDDIEAFVLQVEGRKRWRLYSPLKPDDVLPRVSSQNFKPDQIGKEIFDQVLKPGDVLYFPRGMIHQASTEPGFHSLHITLSVYQKQSYADLLEKLLPKVLENAIKSKLYLRRGLPLNTFQNLGLVYTATDTEERNELQDNIKSLISSIVPSVNEIDAAIDQLAKKYQREALPPVLNAAEQARTIYGSHSYADTKGICRCDYELTLRTNVRLLRANILRLVEEEGSIRIYYHTDNSREYCKYEPNFLDIKRNEAGTIEMLIRSYPSYVGVSQFPITDDDHKIEVATALWELGLLIMEKPFK